MAIVKRYYICEALYAILVRSVAYFDWLVKSCFR